MKDVSRLDAVRAALTAAGEPEPTRSPDFIGSFELTQGSPVELAFWREVGKLGHSEVYSERWPVDATSIEDGAEFRLTGQSGGGEGVFRLDGSIAYLSVGHGEAKLTAASATREGIAAVVAEFRSRYPFAAPATDDLVPITFWSYGKFGPQRHTRRIVVAPWDEIQENYTVAVRDELAGMMDSAAFRPGEDGQLLLWQGPPGTGKTWALRALASEWREWAEFQYITDPDQFFGSAAGDYMVEVLLHESYEDGADEKWRVLILEDTGEMLGANAKEQTGQALSRLLNVVDGLIGQGLRVLVLVTTNDELGVLHPAVSRPGRCASQIEFKPLSPEEVSSWLGGEEAPEGATLAELYARRGKAAPEGETLAAGALPEGAKELFDGTIQLESAATPEVLAQMVESLAPIQDIRPETKPGPEIDTPVQRTDASLVRWTATLAIEGQLTEDRRYIAPGAIRWRELPLTLMAQLTTPETGGHALSQPAGRIDSIYREGNLILAEGVFDEGEVGQEVARLVTAQTLRGNSVDLAILQFEIAPITDFDEEGHRIAETDVDPMDILDGDPNDRPVFVMLDAVIGSSTLVSFPALAGAEISITAGGMRADARRQSGITLVQVVAAEESDAPAVAEPETAEEPDETLMASVTPPVAPPAEWFSDPALEEPTALTITAEGRIFGHAAVWDFCHIGIDGVCTTAPMSQTNYAYFLLGEVETEDGSTVSTGRITLGTGHASKHLNRRAAAEHYDNSGAAVADIVSGEDEHGIWVSGALRPDITPERVRELRGSALSGDWRNVNGNLELVALLAVNVPGFPIPRTRALVAAGSDGAPEVLTLVAAGVYDGRTELTDGMRKQLDALSTVADGGLLALAELAQG